MALQSTITEAVVLVFGWQERFDVCTTRGFLLCWLSSASIAFVILFFISMLWADGMLMSAQQETGTVSRHYRLQTLNMFGRLFNKKKKGQGVVKDAVISSQDPYDKFEHIFSTIKEVSIKYIGELKGEFGGFTEYEIADLERKYSLHFPQAYRHFLKKFAGGQLKIFDGQSYDLTGIATAQEVSAELLLQDGTTLPENAFAFSQWQGYNFCYFINSGSDNPDTFLYMEGGNDTTVNPPKIYNNGHFTDWLVNLAINNVTLIGNLQGYKTDAGITKLKTLLDNGG